MSKKGFSVATNSKAAKQAPGSSEVGENDPDPDVQIRKVSRESDARLAAQVQKGSNGSGGGYTFTGITPGSE